MAKKWPDLTFKGKKEFSIKNKKTKVEDFYASNEEYETILGEFQESLDDLQNKLYAQSKYGILVIFQAMDAAGKDGTLRAVFKNVNPLGLSFKSFKRPTETEIAHDYLWRCFQELPERGKMQVFNRSYYEEVLVVKVNPSIIQEVQQLPEALKTEDIWEKRYEDIRNFESYLTNNGIVVIKFFLHVSKEEQGKRLIERIEDPEKHWKFDPNDVKERKKWPQYMEAFEALINQTATSQNPWHIIPADDKKNMRILVAKTLVDRLNELNLEYPKVDEETVKSLLELKSVILDQNKE
ncbi:MAG: PPK2 family polyphosphate kinase [Leadbetterella sp.]